MFKNNSLMFVHFICHYIRTLTAPKLRKLSSKWLRKSLSWLMKRNIRANQCTGSATSEKTWIPLDSYFDFLGYYLLVNCGQGGKMATTIPRILEYMETANDRM